jgi:exopolysaccharide biosynthesis protein
MRREFIGRQGNTTRFARHIMTSQGHRLLSVGIIMLDVAAMFVSESGRNEQSL